MAENNTARHILDKFRGRAQVTIDYQYSTAGPTHAPTHVCTVYINDQNYGNGSGRNRAEAKEAACQAVINELRRQGYSV